MKILLTHAYSLGEDQKEQAIMRPYVPLGILYVSAWLEKHDYENSVFDSTFSVFDSLCEQLLQQKPDVVGIYTNLMTKLNVLRIIRFIKSEDVLSNCKVVLGGPEVRHHVHNFLGHGADFIVLGEGEETMLELVRHLDTGQSLLSEITGIAYKDSDGKIVQNPERPKIKDVDILPFPNRLKVDMSLYFDAWKTKHGMSAASVNTMRGCPYTCKWCSTAVYGQSYRRRSPKLVVDEMEWIQKQYSVDTIWFVDDVFTVSHVWLQEFADEVELRGLDLPYECITRADRMNEEVIRNLKRSGCFRVWIGAESGSQRVIDLMDRRVDVNQVREMIQLSKKHGIETGTFIMLGYPGETEADIYETLEHLKRSDPDHYTITVAYPIKGTGLYTEVQNNFIDPLPWESSTDRQIDFKRTYNRRYYEFAVRMIVNEMKAYKAEISFRGLWFRVKSLMARSGMSIERSISLRLSQRS
jgi:radical SAM superfamily enzyme YgiQ (UPF0313 family)